jgi:FKBP-type peptidyl-prolyl cis-trans isomerase
MMRGVNIGHTFAANFNCNMKKHLTAVALFLTALSAVSQIQIESTTRPLKNERDSISFFLGQLMGSSIAQSPFTNVDLDLLFDGFKQSFTNPTAVNMDQCNAYVQEAAQRKESEKYAGNKEAGQNFLKDNAKKKGVVSTASGLQYEVVTMGKGKMPMATDEVTVHYRGTLIDGTQFDSSYDRNEPATFPLNGVIKGWTEGVQLMPIGSKFKFYIPYDLAYGEGGAGGTIPPFSTLIFEVELISIK